MLNDRLKEARISAGLTQKEVAETIGIATTTYNGYERGKSDPDVGTLCKIMNLLGVDANFVYQDYNVNKNSPAPEGAEEQISMEESNRLFDALVQAGLISDSIELSVDDRAFLVHVIGLLDVWIRGKRK